MWILWLAGCGSLRDCEEVDISSVSELPERLSDAFSPEALPYEVRFELWSDGAQKRRWLQLPDGAAVDTSRPGDWDFPVGTRLFKEFARGGEPIETRMIERLDSGWTGVSYRWLPDGSDAVALPEGEEDAAGTGHDVPGASLCVACHGGRASFVLGYSAVQVSPEVDLPGDELDQEALGYLHANCSHCHNPDREVGVAGSRCYDPDSDIDFTLPPQADSVEDLPAIVTADRFLGDEDDSFVLHKVSRRNQSALDPSMPPLGTEQVDEDGVDLLTRWISRR
jgi:hypothetical protein